MRRILKILFSFLSVSLMAVAGCGYWFYSAFHQPGPLARDAVLIIKPGSSVNAIARDLAAAEVISNPFVFRVGARFLDSQGPLQAGEYAFPASVSARGAVEVLQSGKTVVRRVTFAEGLTSFEIIEQLSQTPGLTGTVRQPVAEGSLLPETYHYSFGDERAAVVQRMTADMATLVAELWAARAEGLPFKTPAEAVVLASIVEKETGIAAERTRVAGVFVNRLRKGIRLQSDPTVVYGITRGRAPLGRPLSRTDLKRPTPFNTYVIRALPPTPIANPGRQALEAVMHPMETDELYFVADGTGGHVFAKTLKEHNRNVARWRKIERQRRDGG